MERPSFAACVGTCVLTALATPSTTMSQDGPPLEVSLESPHGGVVPGPTVQVEATVSDPKVTEALLVVNGASYHVPVEQGRVTQGIVAVPGNNRVGIVVRDRGRVARDSTTFRYEGEPVEMVVLLTWPAEGEIIDLWVREPGGETCKWDHRGTQGGGRLLDFSTDAIGFGSQAYVTGTVRPGSFRIKVHYWGGWAENDQRRRWDYENLINRVDELEQSIADASTDAERHRLTEERDRTRRLLDRWATPAAPQTPVHAEVVVFPGTRAERRWRFDVVVDRTGALATLGEVEVSEEMIRAARGAR